MKKAIFLTLLGLLLVIGTLGGIKGAQIKTLIDGGASFSEPPTSIASFIVKEDQWENTLTAISSLEAAKGLLITSDLSGRIAKIHFDAGSQVKAGDLLIQQDTSTERAQLRSARAAADLAKANLERIRELYGKNVASKSELDSAVSNYDAAVADVDNIIATIEKKSIRAPFDGRLGIRLVNLGQTIDAGESVVSLQATNQMFANFSLPQQYLSQLEPGLAVRLTTDAIPDKQFTGTINAIDPEIDAATRSIKLQAILANPERELLPGMFASIEVILPGFNDVVLIPITAVQYATFGDSVFLIEAAEAQPAQTQEGESPPPATSESQSEPQKQEQRLVAKQQFVKLGETRGDYVVVSKGLSTGQEIVGMGVFKLRNGAPVVINNSVLPEFSLNPDVDDQ